MTESARRRAQARRRRVWLVLSLAGLALAGMITARVMARREASHDRELIQESTRLFQKGESERGTALLLKLLQKTPNNPSVLRELARRCDEFQGPAEDSLRFWQQVTKSPEATESDRIGLAGAMVKTGDGTGARAVLDALSEPARQDVRSIELEAELLRQEGRNEEANKILVAAWQRTASEPHSRLKLAQAGFTSLPDAVRGEAGRVLWQFAEGTGPRSIEALTTLAAARPNAAAVDKMRKILGDRDDVKSVDRYNVLRLCILQFPALEEEIVESESGRLETVPLEKRGDFYEWLGNLGSYRRILQDLGESPEPGPASPPGTIARKPKAPVLVTEKLFLAYAGALLSLREWDEFELLLRNPELPLNHVEAALMRAIAAHSRKQTRTIIDSHLSDALSLARKAKGTHPLSRVAFVAEKLDQPRVSLEALKLLSKDRRLRFDSLQRAFQLQEALRDAEGKLETAQAILEIRPGLQPYADEVLYLGILTGTRIEESSQLASESELEPDSAPSPLRRLVKALVAYHSGDSESLRTELAGLDPASLGTGPRAVMAGLISETSDRARAFGIANKIAPAALAPDEFWFYRLTLR